jgi:preprotein translocase subunit SecD
MKSKPVYGLLLILLIAAIAAAIVIPEETRIPVGEGEVRFRLVRGLDLRGGLQVLLESDLPSGAVPTSEQLTTARNIVENRVNALGLTEPLVQIAGNRRIVVELPGVEDPEEAIATLKETGLLEFVDMSSLTPQEAVLLVGQAIQTDFGLPADTPAPAGPATPAAEASPAVEASPTPAPLVFHTVMTGAELENASATTDQLGRPAVEFSLSDAGARLFADYTAAHVGDTLAIVLDKVVISTPVINTAIPGGEGTIEGDFTLEEANQLAVQLRYGSLPVPLRVVESKNVGPTLGEESLDRSLRAGAIGLAVVAFFMAAYYRLPGILADLALGLYALVTIALFKLIPVTLTLPGVAGFVLSLGVAVDANILIFERMREELRAGRTLQQAIELGWSRAWPSIRDSNLSTLLTCGILFWFGNTFGASLVKGFALTLALGVLVSLFTAIRATRVLMHVVLDNLRLAEHRRWFGI